MSVRAAARGVERELGPRRQTLRLFAVSRGEPDLPGAVSADLRPASRREAGSAHRRGVERVLRRPAPRRAGGGERREARPRERRGARQRRAAPALARDPPVRRRRALGRADLDGRHARDAARAARARGADRAPACRAARLGRAVDEQNAIVNVGRAIQLSVAPVFLLSAIGAMLAVMTNRLARVVDRARGMEQKIEHATADERTIAERDLAVMSRRARLINLAITLCTITAMLVCAVVAAMFSAAFLE